MTDCVHHWKLDQSVGDAAHGRCANCGAERDFTGGIAWGDLFDGRKSHPAKVTESEAA